MKEMKEILDNERGVVLVISLMILTLLVGAGVGAIVSTQTDLKTSGNVKIATQAFYIAAAGIERGKAEISGSKTFDSILAGTDGNKANTNDNGILSFGASDSFNGGTYTVSVTDNNDETPADVWDDSDDKVYITSTGSLGGSESVLKVLVTKASLDFKGAMNIVDDECELEFKGSALIDGNDKTFNPQNPNTPDNGSGPATNGIARDCATSNNDDIQAGKESDIRGSGASSPDITNDLGSLTLAALQATRSNLISQADTIYNGTTTINGGTLGTRSSPKITYVNGSLTIQGGPTGVGFLIVNENFEVKGNFTFEGIILIGICNTCAGRIKGTGNAKIYGAMVLANPTLSHSGEARIKKMQGNTTIYYSTFAIDLAIKNTFKTLVWQEVIG